MWPKAFAQLIELLPHITRLIPMADLFFQSKTASEKANEAAMKTLAEDVRGDLGKVTSVHDGLYRQLQAQSAQITELQAEVTRTRIVMESYTDRQVQKQTATLRVWLQIIVVLLVLVLGGLVALIVHFR